MPAPGTTASDFRLMDQHGQHVSLSELRGQPVLVYFYPRDETRGCTTQACGIRDHWSEFEATGTVVLGISPDDVASHAAFAANHGLPHRLLADPQRVAIDAYDAWGWRDRRGERVIGVIRSTYLIDPDGKIARAWPKVDPGAHAEEVLAAIAELGEVSGSSASSVGQ